MNISDIIHINRALVSVSDKTNLETLAKLFKEFSIEVLSTGGTAKKLESLGVKTIEVSDHTGFPEMMDGRVKTLHPTIHGGLLARRDNQAHIDAMDTHNIAPIDLVVVNLYPFEETVASGSPPQEVIENIDIGGPSMIRSAAKNHDFVTIITAPEDYTLLYDELKNTQGGTSLAFRREMAGKAFSRTASYDASISQWFGAQSDTQFPDRLNITASLHHGLRYGENPHQAAAFYRFDHAQSGLPCAEQLHGKQLSYNNINDCDSAWSLVQEFAATDAAAVAIIKHATPCGVAIADTLSDAFQKALACDPTSAFGGIVALNRPVDKETASNLSTLFLEAIIAPSFSKDALAILTKKKNIRLLAIALPEQPIPAITLKTIEGGILAQQADHGKITESDMSCVTEKHPDEQLMRDLAFAFKVCKHVKSNAIVLAKDGATIGIGAGQMSRVDASRIAAMKASDCSENPDRAKGAVLASDAFFPFADGVEKAADAGICAIIQPGGSVRDEEVIQAANKHNIAMVFTGIRHFKH